MLNERLTDAKIKGKLADWLPQIGFSYGFQHNYELPAVNFNGNLIHTGTENTSAAEFGATQTLFNRDVLLAARSAKVLRLSARQSTEAQKIDLAASVSKAFYDYILTEQQLHVLDADLLRIRQSLQDATYQYQSGLVDKTDYKRATISLNNATAQRRSAAQMLKAKAAVLRGLMGLPDDADLRIAYDTLKMESEAMADTLQMLDYGNRIEVQQLETQRTLQQFNLQYYRWAFLPSLSAYGNYNLNYLNNVLPELYRTAYPNSYAGLSLSLPLFQGGKRVQQIRQADLELRQVDNNLKGLKQQINSEYEAALAAYKSSLYNFTAQQENRRLANEVYEVIRLQYRAGVKAYLDVITAETDLRTAQINYYNALYQLLFSKVDLERALGNLDF